MRDLTVIKHNGGAYIDSREAAEVIGKNHNHLLRDIRGYCEIIDRIGGTDSGRASFFIESAHIDAWGKKKPCFLLSKMGCELVANKLVGERGILFTAAYVKKFNEMERMEHTGREAMAGVSRLSVFNAAVRNVLSGYARTYASADEVMNFLRGAYRPFGIEVATDVGGGNFTTATHIAWLCGMYSESGRLHSRAVSAIIEKLGVGSEHIAVIPYGLVGVSMRYDGYVLDAVRGWLAQNSNPRCIPHGGFEYHVWYGRSSTSDGGEYFYSDFDDDDD